jgi:hypothetical protein
MAVWALISHKPWRARWSAWYRKTGKLLPLMRQNSQQRLNIHKIHAQSIAVTAQIVLSARSVQTRISLMKTKIHGLPLRARAAKA